MEDTGLNHKTNLDSALKFDVQVYSQVLTCTSINHAETLAFNLSMRWKYAFLAITIYN